jgi:hypothetical protein
MYICRLQHHHNFSILLLAAGAKYTVPRNTFSPLQPTPPIRFRLCWAYSCRKLSLAYTKLTLVLCAGDSLLKLHIRRRCYWKKGGRRPTLIFKFRGYSSTTCSGLLVITQAIVDRFTKFKNGEICYDVVFKTRYNLGELVKQFELWRERNP